MVFDRAPDQALVTRYTNLMITNPDWGAARLRQELRKSPEGTKGGRLLVPEEFPTIRAAIEAAVPGNAVYVAPGVYRENILLNKAVNLIGAGRDRVTVETTHDLNALSVSKVSSGVIIRGFTFRHTGTEDAELRKFLVSIDGSTVIFEENAVLKGNGDGINLKEGAVGTIRNNVVKDNRWSGISLFAGVSGSIVDNVFEGNQTGIEVRESVTRMEIRSNQVRTSAYNGMWLAESDNVTLVDNRVTDNGAPGTNYGGIGIGKGRPILRGNLAHGNRSTGIWWRETASPNIQGGNISDGKELPAQ
jgi:parallel beta-helix repeat protein